MADSVRFSVLIPVYNVSEYLPECLDSILRQTYHNYEVIIIDDGSSDGSEKICDKYSNDNDSIIVVHQHNKGLMMARRAAIGIASGDYCIFVDSDDWVSNNLMRELCDRIDVDSPDILFFNKSLYFENSRQYVEKPPLFASTNPSANDVKSKMLLCDDLNNLVIKCVKTNLLKKDTFDYNTICLNPIGEDLIQSFPIVDFGESFGYLDKHLYFYRQNPKSMTKEFAIDNLSKEFGKFNVDIWGFRIDYCCRWFAKDNSMMEKLLNYYAYSIVQHFYKGYSHCNSRIKKQEWFALPWDSLCKSVLQEAIDKKKIRLSVRLQFCSILKKRVLILDFLLILRRIKKAFSSR